jgi:hypothetical protein
VIVLGVPAVSPTPAMVRVVAGWIQRLRGRLTGKPADADTRRVEAALAGRTAHRSTQAWLEAVLAALPPGVGAHVLARVALGLGGPAGDGDVPEDDGAALRRFWAALAARFPSEPSVRAYHADAELRFGDEQTALEGFLGAFEVEPALWFDFADDIGELPERVGGEALFRWQLVELRAVLDHVPDDDEWVRERYSELLDAYRDQPERLLRLYPIGEEIRRLESEGTLPRAIVLRSPRPPRRTSEG